MPVVSNATFLRECFDFEWASAHITGFAEDPAALEGLGLKHYWAGRRWSGWHNTDALAAQNAYFTISLFSPDPADGKARRRKALFKSTHVVVLDDVGTKVLEADVLAKMPQPSWKLETSPGNFQWGYILGTPETDAGRVNALLDGMIAKGLCADGKDPGMKGVTRYVRLPVGRNSKAKYGAGGFECAMSEWEPGRKFAMEDLAGPWGIDLPVAGAASAGVGRVAVGTGEDELFDLLDRWGMVDSVTSDGLGWNIECPWMDEHTGGANSGAAYWRGGGFKCHHGHCEGKGRREIYAWANERVKAESGGLVEFGACSFDVVPGYVPAYSGARGKVAVVPSASSAAPVVVAGASGTGGTHEEAFFAENIYVAPEDRFFSLRTGELLTRGAIDFGWLGRLSAAGALPVVSPRTGECMAPSRWFCDEANMGRARQADRVTYWPGAGPYFRDGDMALVNKWSAPGRLGLEVRDADIEPWMKLVRHVVGVEGRAIVEVVLDWFALVVGAPGVKPGWHLVVQGGQGLGKDRMILPVMAGVGTSNVGTVNATGLHSSFNAWAERRMVIVNELKQKSQGTATGADQYTVLKELTENSHKTVKINQKNQKEYYARNVSAYYVTSNDERAIALEEDDRRFLVVMAAGVRPWSKDAFTELAGWMDERGGDGLVAEWLHQRWEAMGLERRDALMSRAPETTGKAKMIAANEDAVLCWTREQIETGAWPTLMTSGDLARAYSAASKSGVGGFGYAVAPQRWGAALKRLGGGHVYNGEPVRLKSGERARLWAVRLSRMFEGWGEPELAKAYISAAGSDFTDFTDAGGDVPDYKFKVVVGGLTLLEELSQIGL